MVDYSVSRIIAQQLGGNKFKAMTGATFIGNDSDNMLIVKFKGSRKSNVLHIKLDPNDTYSMTFYRHGPKSGIKIVEQFDTIYCDQLTDIFEQVTGLYTSL